MHAVVAAADALDEPTIVLLGHPTYYPHFMVRHLDAWPAADGGPFRNAPAFDDL